MFDDAVLSEGTSQKSICCTIPLERGTESIEITQGESWVGARGWTGGREFLLAGDRGLVLQDDKVLEAEDGDGCPEKVNILNAPELRTSKWLPQ